MQIGHKICLVTGASSGIGYAIAETLSKEGYTVIATARRADRLLPLQANNVDILTGDIVATVKFIMAQPAHVRIPGLMILPKDHLI